VWTIGKLTDVAIRAWIKAGERFEGPNGEDGLVEVQVHLPHFNMHDFRRTARTHLAALGVEPEVSGRCLNHEREGAEGVYNRHGCFEERHRALEASWGSCW
jgi:integrase